MPVACTDTLNVEIHCNIYHTNQSVRPSVHPPTHLSTYLPTYHTTYLSQ